MEMTPDPKPHSNTVNDGNTSAVNLFDEPLIAPVPSVSGRGINTPFEQNNDAH